MEAERVGAALVEMGVLRHGAQTAMMLEHNGSDWTISFHLNKAAIEAPTLADMFTSVAVQLQDKVFGDHAHVHVAFLDEYGVTKKTCDLVEGPTLTLSLSQLRGGNAAAPCSSTSTASRRGA